MVLEGIPGFTGEKPPLTAELTQNSLAIRQCCEACQKTVGGEIGAKCVWEKTVRLQGHHWQRESARLGGRLIPCVY